MSYILCIIYRDSLELTRMPNNLGNAFDIAFQLFVCRVLFLHFYIISVQKIRINLQMQEFSYYCRVHPTMIGKIIVVPYVECARWKCLRYLSVRN